MSNEKEEKEQIIFYKEMNKETREIHKYQISIATIIIPILLGIVGFLYNEQEVPKWSLYLLGVGLTLIFMTIPVNIMSYIPSEYTPVNILEIIKERSIKNRRMAHYLAFILSIGMLISYVAIFLNLVT